jgi:pimeloyl-ACP methyl ester carboxylesterase
MTTFVLIHGGGHGGWCWKWCAAALRARGHEVYAPTLTGFGERAHLAAPDFETFVTDVANVVAFEDLHDVVLVGHSMGGVIVPASPRPSRHASPPRCGSRPRCAPKRCRNHLAHPFGAVTIGADGTAHTDAATILAANIHDGTPEQQAFVHERHLAYPPHALTEPGRLSAFLALGIATAYVFATDDRTIEPHVQREMAARLPGARTAEVHAGHDCMVTQPEATAAALEAVG